VALPGGLRNERGGSQEDDSERTGECYEIATMTIVVLIGVVIVSSTQQVLTVYQYGTRDNGSILKGYQ
jgi:hypothetical protein